MTFSQSIYGVNVHLAINLTMATRRCASIRNHLDSSNPANWEKIGIKITENLSNKQLCRIYLDNKKYSSDNVGSGAEQVDAAQTNNASVNSSGLVNIGDTETIHDNLQLPSNSSLTNINLDTDSKCTDESTWDNA